MLKLTKSDIPFTRDDSGRFIPRIIAIVMVLVTFMCLLSISLGESLKHSSDAQAGRVLVQIPAQDGQAEITQKVMGALSASSVFKQVEQMDDAQLKKQMQPWLGELDAFDALPIPNVIRIQWKKEDAGNVERLRNLLAPISSTIQVDAPSEWAANFARFSSLIQTVLLLLSGALIAAAITLLVFTATTSLKLHQRTVSLLHSIGAHDDYIAAQFQANAALLAFKGAAIGSLIALLLFAVVGFVIRSLNVAMLPDLGVGVAHLLVVILLVCGAAFIGFCTARWATFRYLNQFL
jgi:cell division transport system permease protein